MYVSGIFAKNEFARVAAYCDIYQDKLDAAGAKYSGAKSFTKFQDILASDVDAVLIATPAFLHPEHFEAAARARKHIYCEKPAGADVAGVKRLERAARAADPAKAISFGFQQRHSPEYLAAERILRSGQLGEVVLMRSDWLLGGAAWKSFTSPYPPEEQRIRHWGAWRETSGDFIVEQDCHGLDVLNWFAQSHPLKAHGTGGRRKRAFGDNLDHLNVTFEYPNGLRGFLAATQLAVKRYWDVKEQFFGSEGVLETERKYYRWHRGENDAVRVESKREITIDAVEVFLERILTGKPVNEALSACESTLTSLLGRLAIDTGREVTWEELAA
ncbi:MAG: Gfo/Idh/MocA family oxidoreductase [Acidobacteria bacterium]|nr:Gfo/Idh/MocA family oxidoreductase [Acidobacteriota bacterium]